MLPATSAVIDVERTAQRPSAVVSVAAAARALRRHSETNDCKVDSLRRFTSAPVFQASTRNSPRQTPAQLLFRAERSGSADGHIASPIVGPSTVTGTLTI